MLLFFVSFLLSLVLSWKDSDSNAVFTSDLSAWLSGTAEKSGEQGNTPDCTIPPQEATDCTLHASRLWTLAGLTCGFIFAVISLHLKIRGQIVHRHSNTQIKHREAKEECETSISNLLQGKLLPSAPSSPSSSSSLRKHPHTVPVWISSSKQKSRLIKASHTAKRLHQQSQTCQGAASHNPLPEKHRWQWQRVSGNWFVFTL